MSLFLIIEVIDDFDEDSLAELLEFHRDNYAHVLVGQESDRVIDMSRGDVITGRVIAIGEKIGNINDTDRTLYLTKGNR